MNVKIKLFLSKMNAASSNKLTQRFMTIRSYINEKNFKLAVKIVLGLVFIVSGISKLIDPELLTIQLEGFKFLNPFVIEIIAYSLILFEMILGALILFKTNRKVLFTTVVTLTVFSLFLMYKIITHDQSLCGCFGNFILASNHQELTQNLILLAMGVYLI